MATIMTAQVARTRSGRLRGTEIEGVSVFKGVRYAASPFGANRFLPPQPVEPWSGVRDALEFGPKPPQLPYPPPWDELIGEYPVTGEDCLSLNIWAPELETGRHPVMVWIPGGMFESGTGVSDFTSGIQFARDGVVCVTINYRVGPDGFLYFGEGDANLGLLDQIAALEWVRDNIAAFGGDPANVTVFGESAGAMCIGMLLAMPRARGLFRRAIVQSGGAQQLIPVDTAQRVGRILAETLGVAPTRAAIASVPVEQLMAAHAQMKTELVTRPDPERWGRDAVSTMLAWQPVLDGATIPARPLDLIAAGSAAGIDVLVGSNTDESNFFLVPTGMIDQVTEEMLVGACTVYGLPVESALRAYRAADPDASAGELLADIQTDWLFRIPAVRLAEAHVSAPGHTYMYEYAWHSPLFGGRFGAAHGTEIPCVFDTLNDHGQRAETDPPQELADTMHAAWTRFASTGTCDWPAYDLGQRATMRFDMPSGVVDDPRPAMRALWEGIR